MCSELPLPSLRRFALCSVHVFPPYAKPVNVCVYLSLCLQRVCEKEVRSALILGKNSHFQLPRISKVYTKPQMLVTVISGLGLRHDKLMLSRFHLGNSAYSCTDPFASWWTPGRLGGTVTTSSIWPWWWRLPPASRTGAEWPSQAANTGRGSESRANVKFSSARVF